MRRRRPQQRLRAHELVGDADHGSPRRTTRPTTRSITNIPLPSCCGPLRPMSTSLRDGQPRFSVTANRQTTPPVQPTSSPRPPTLGGVRGHQTEGVTNDVHPNRRRLAWPRGPIARQRSVRQQRRPPTGRQFVHHNTTRRSARRRRHSRREMIRSTWTPPASPSTSTTSTGPWHPAPSGPTGRSMKRATN